MNLQKTQTEYRENAERMQGEYLERVQREERNISEGIKEIIQYLKR